MSKCDYCDNTNSCRTCGLTYDDGVKDGRAQAIKELVNVAAGRQNITDPEDRLVLGRLKVKIARKLLGRVTTDEIDNVEQGQMILDAMRLLAEALKEGGKE